MRVRLLGTAAGGGIPQWNCACAGCARARGTSAARTQDCVAVSGDGRSWYLLNASPDLRAQLLAAPELAPGPGRRETPLCGVLLSTAELDHTLGLLTLREARELAVYGTAAVLDALAGPFPVRPMLDHYTAVSWHTVAPGTPVPLRGGLAATALPVGAKPPRYAPATGGDWVVAYRITDQRTGAALVYAPCLPAIDDAFLDAAAGAAYAILDGTFLHEDEMVRATGGGRTATAMGHLPITASLPRLAGLTGTTVLYTHLNNTNPVAAASGDGHLTAAGAEVATDGRLITL
ncbi:pyrroloquinoline quinone biosynthesis protein PqqB [Actinomycetes bacterium KLBMP 9797]